ncbi:ATPase domain-containing protein [Arsukibacterium sp.]|uniref:ATPase domain-containing protein n=1 Tax=Arsukibacterium sp. TaxID=1977258 RepID=UPI001BD340A2|nr:ATPase domain-containing protein [Arsukibacterium sp.]
MSKKATIRRLSTDVPGLDNLLGGGLPEFSFNLIVGPPGSGKTTLAHQMMFSLATPDTKALYFTVLGEPALKMLRYQQQFAFFDISKIEESIQFVNLSADLLDGAFDRVLLYIAEKIKVYAPKFVFVDSFHSLARSAKEHTQGDLDLPQFVQQLGIQMNSWQATSFLIGEYVLPESETSPIFAMADGIVCLSQSLHRNSLLRKIQVIKMRGQAQRSGLHTFRIDDDGVRIFPRAIVKGSISTKVAPDIPGSEIRVAVGTPGLDDMLGGGLPVGYSLLVVGPSGCGKSILATQFLAEGVRRGESGVIAAFEKSPSQLLGNMKLYSMVESGEVGVINTRSLDLSIDETLHDMLKMIQKMKAKRVVIDSLSGFELALAPEFSENFRASLYRMIAELTDLRVTILMTSELEDRYTDLRFSPFGNAFLADAIIMQRYVELAGQFKRVISVVKVRSSAHSKDIRLFEITDEGIVIGEVLADYKGITTGSPGIDRYDKE